jgi:hypothetical protein
LPFFSLKKDPQVFFATIEGRRPERVDFIPDAAWDVMVDCWKHSPRERPEINLLIGRLEKLIDPSMSHSQESDYWLNSPSMPRAIRQPSPFIPSEDELEKLLEDIKSSSNSLLSSELQHAVGMELDNAIADTLMAI